MPLNSISIVFLFFFKDLSYMLIGPPLPIFHFNPGHSDAISVFLSF